MQFLETPQWLPLPWSTIDDFIEAPNGDIYVDSKFYNRIIRHDKAGRFIASYSYPLGTSKFTNLAVDVEGRIYVYQEWQISICSPELKILSQHSVSSSGGHTYSQLDVNGQLVLKTASQIDLIPKRTRRVLRPGDTVFTNLTRDAETNIFTCDDGSFLVRKGWGVKKYSGQHMLANYNSPWFLMPFALPWPGIIAWIGFMIVMFIKMNSFQGQRNIQIVSHDEIQ